MVMILGGLRDWRHDAPENDFGKGLCVDTTQSRDTAPRHVSGGALVQCARRFTEKVAPCKVIVRRGVPSLSLGFRKDLSHRTAQVL